MKYTLKEIINDWQTGWILKLNDGSGKQISFHENLDSALRAIENQVHQRDVNDSINNGTFKYLNKEEKSFTEDDLPF